MIRIDGSKGEGGGQVLRTSLAMSMVTGQPFRIEKIRANRRKPGLKRQHLTAVKAAAAVSDAVVTGAEINSTVLSFLPKTINFGEYRFAVGTAGSAVLVLQTVLPALLMADGSSSLVLEGGTHNSMAPPFDFLDCVFLPRLQEMGVNVSAELERAGFYPAGGGRFTLQITPARKLKQLKIEKRGDLVRRRAVAWIVNLPTQIAKRELKIVQRKLGLADDEVEIRSERNELGPGNVLMIDMQYEGGRELVTGFGERNKKSERVADEAVQEARSFIASGAPVGEHLADQLMIPMALAGGGSLRCSCLSRHARTNIQTIRGFLDIDVECDEAEDRSVLVSISS